MTVSITQAKVSLGISKWSKVTEQYWILRRSVARSDYFEGLEGQSPIWADSCSTNNGLGISTKLSRAAVATFARSLCSVSDPRAMLCTTQLMLFLPASPRE